MSEWTATNELRFVERTIKGKWIGDYYGEPMYESRVVRVLQQRWEQIVENGLAGYKIESEWRDVPVLEEE